MTDFRALWQAKKTVLDVRTPKEFEQGRLPGSSNFPIFSNDERHEVGICYKQKGRDEAVKLGLEFVGPKLSGFVADAEQLCDGRTATLYCWRGGMRSGSMAWLLKTAGFEIDLIPGGYKTWRRAALESFQHPLNLINLAGFTGSGKTEVLAALQAAGEQVVDLEALANHRGSAFGQMGSQPSTEQFENEVAYRLMQFDPKQTIWIEDESRSIGKVYMPHELILQMHKAPLVWVQRSEDERIKSICDLYGQTSTNNLIKAFERIQRRMGGQFTKAAINHLRASELEEAAQLALRYYDSSYQHSMQKRNAKPDFSVAIEHSSFEDAAQTLIEWRNKNQKR